MCNHVTSTVIFLRENLQTHWALKFFARNFNWFQRRTLQINKNDSYQGDWYYLLDKFLKTITTRNNHVLSQSQSSLVYSYRMVIQTMNSKVVFSIRSIVTIRARKRPVSSVGSHVTFAMAILSKNLRAHWTLKLSVSNLNWLW